MLVGYVTAFMGGVAVAPPANSKYTKNNWSKTSVSSAAFTNMDFSYIF
jgi:hypothetical protein